ncbi:MULTISPECIES: flagellar basal body-associated FliL family protein [Rhodobacterales]|uniref:flagellar basal body-associated FliL family protein n=1 Tax=Ascidiaceihabitans sp. TaxID=1872644 RepID=UPI003298C68C
MKKLLPLILLLVGSGAGVGAGVFLRPPPPEMTEEEAQIHAEKQKELDSESESEEPPTSEYVKLNNQFVVPIVNDERVNAMVVMSLSIEVEAGQKDAVFLREPKLRDSFLQVLFDHAHIGGFDGEFTSARNLAILRQALVEIARKDMGDTVTDVLIQEIARQDY